MGFKSFVLSFPIFFAGCIKFVPGFMPPFFEQGAKVMPGLDPPPPDALPIMGGTEIAVGLLILTGVAPKLFNTVGFLQYFTPIILMGKGFLAHPPKPYLTFVLLLHLACGVPLLLKAWGDSCGVFSRFSMMAPILVVALAKFTEHVGPAPMADITEKLNYLAPGTELPPPDVLVIMGYQELFSIAMVTLGLFPKLFNTIAAVQYATPIFLLGGKFAAVTNYYIFVLIFHGAIALNLLDDAWYIFSSEPATEKLKKK